MIDLVGAYREYRVIKSLESSKELLVNRFDTLNKLYNSKPREKSESFFIIEYDESERLRKINRIKEQKGSQLNLIDKTHRIVTGILNSSHSKFVFSHNHPGGKVNPSTHDVLFTISYKKFLRKNFKELVDHIIWTKNETYSFSKDSELLRD